MARFGDGHRAWCHAKAHLTCDSHHVTSCKEKFSMPLLDLFVASQANIWELLVPSWLTVPASLLVASGSQQSRMCHKG